MEEKQSGPSVPSIKPEQDNRMVLDRLLYSFKSGDGPQRLMEVLEEQARKGELHEAVLSFPDLKQAAKNWVLTHLTYDLDVEEMGELEKVMLKLTKLGVFAEGELGAMSVVRDTALEKLDYCLTERLPEQNRALRNLYTILKVPDLPPDPFPHS